jgi:hypothetical protein
MGTTPAPGEALAVTARAAGPSGEGDVIGVGLGVGSVEGLGLGVGPASDGDGDGAAAEALLPLPFKTLSQLTPEPANGSQVGAPPVSQTRVPGPRPRTKMASNAAKNSPKMTPSSLRSLPCIRVRSG